MAYFKSIFKDAPDFWAVFVSYIGAILIIITTDSNEFMLFRYISGIMITIFLPGYSLHRLLFIRNSEVRILEVLALSIIFSAVLDILVGLILYYFWVLLLEQIIILLSIITFACLFISQILKSKLNHVKKPISSV